MTRALATLLWLERVAGIRLQLWQRRYMIALLTGQPTFIRKARRGGWRHLETAIVAVADHEGGVR